MIESLLSMLLACTAPNVEEILANVAQSRQSLSGGTLQMRYEERHSDGRPITCDMAGFFRGDGEFGIEISNHSWLAGMPAAQRSPQCTQIVADGRLIGMLRRYEQSFFVDDVRSARLRLFNPKWIGLYAFPSATADAGEALFWNTGQARLVPSPPDRPNLIAIEVSGVGTTTMLIDPARGWNIVEHRTVQSGYCIEVRSELQQFGQTWFPAQCWMKQSSAESGASAEVYIEVARADFTTVPSDEQFGWRRLGPPARGHRSAVLDRRIHGTGGFYGWWDGQTLTRKDGSTE